ncbi:hypothetical protein L210DRAFT_3640826 [Boletus edulis BED1]|uniref:Uncharacterized protein n=1 Tax=Boletus edulis BED1 TaxID=1328754 RepID=A0AAD4GLE2_BOLED|nr:hypothetical protein L210DRAFT_3640826 [Boletus edulis BED1]
MVAPKKRTKKGKEREDLSTILTPLHNCLDTEAGSSALIGPGCPGPAPVSAPPPSDPSAAPIPSFLKVPSFPALSFAAVAAHPPIPVVSSLQVPPAVPHAHGPPLPLSLPLEGSSAPSAAPPPLCLVLDCIRALRRAPDPSDEHTAYLRSIFDKAVEGVDFSIHSQVTNLISLLAQVAPGQDFGAFLPAAMPSASFHAFPCSSSRTLLPAFVPAPISGPDPSSASASSATIFLCPFPTSAVQLSSHEFLLPHKVVEVMQGGWCTHIPLTAFVSKTSLVPPNRYFSSSKGSRTLSSASILDDCEELLMPPQDWCQAWPRLVEAVSTFLPSAHKVDISHLWKTHFKRIWHRDDFVKSRSSGSSPARSEVIGTEGYGGVTGVTDARMCGARRLRRWRTLAQDLCVTPLSSPVSSYLE